MRTLNRNELKLIAICAMLCDHIAWGFVDFLSPIGQIMHVVGRMTIPIMCFFIAEGFRHTTNLQKYIYRMICFWIISIVPFYMFFGEMYNYRQNIILDLLLGLLVLTVLEHPDFRKWEKVLLTALLFGISLTIGGWPVLPTLYILIFYYVKPFKKQAIWFCLVTIFFVAFLAVLITLNNIWHFSGYDWIWYDKLYLLGFMLPLFFLSRYNGKPGKPILGKYFFYLFYPLHFVVLSAIHMLLTDFSFYNAYVILHVVAPVICLFILLKIATSKPSKAQVSVIVFVIAAIIYSFGFLIEITTLSADGFYSAIKVEYFGECLLIIGFTWFIKEFFQKNVPIFIYAAEIVFSGIIMWAIFTFKDNHIFYKSLTVTAKGPFPRVVLEYGIGFYLFVLYLALACGCAIFIGIRTIIQSKGIHRKRIICTLFAILCPWIPVLMRETGLTCGYEVPAFGVIGAAIFIDHALMKYSYFDSVSLAGENALNRSNEGILVIDKDEQIVFLNRCMKKLLGTVKLSDNLQSHDKLKEIFAGKIKTLEKNERIYEMRIDPLTEGGYTQGYMLWAVDLTEYHNQLREIQEIARKDSLTGISNRKYYRSEVISHLNSGGTGSMFMLDLDNFKQVNDTYGHQAGDTILILLSNILKKQLGTHNLACRIGGDEFSLFFKNNTDCENLASLARSIIDEFQAALENTEYRGVTTVSIGIACISDDMMAKLTSADLLEKLYSRADKALYLSKNSGKNTYHFYRS